jgi:hypothetical protein
MMAEKIKILLIKTKMNVVQLAKAKNTSSQNIYNKLSRDNFTVKELQEIAEITGAELEINFIIKRDGKEERI